jgi:hypothetical protein
MGVAFTVIVQTNYWIKSLWFAQDEFQKLGLWPSSRQCNLIEITRALPQEYGANLGQVKVSNVNMTSFFGLTLLKLDLDLDLGTSRKSRLAFQL